MSSLPVSQPVRRKRSVADINELVPPSGILEYCRLAYFEEFINDDDRLEHSALIAALYLGGFRINEALRLLKSQFKRRKSLEGREFVVIEMALVEKSGGKMRNCALVPSDPISLPLQAHLTHLREDEPLFSLTDRTALNITDRISKGVAWNHWFREQRTTFLAAVFTKDERKKIFGWSGGARKNAREMADRYEFLNWMSYADRLGRLTDSYWQNEPVPVGTKTWLDSLSIVSTATTT